jgi:1,4-alpha-glucan branching enzyme
MKKNHTSLTPNSEPHTKPVHIEFNHETATMISIAGTFNNWRPTATPMVSLGAGRWVKELALPPGVYEYRFVVDGEWMTDPRSSETAINPFGELNSVLKVKEGAN